VSENYALAKQLIEDNRELLDRIAEALLERETIEAKDIQLLVAGEQLPPLPPPEVSEATAAPAAATSDSKDRPSRDKLPDPEPVAG
jgi:cell division protease FtsH